MKVLGLSYVGLVVADIKETITRFQSLGFQIDGWIEHPAFSARALTMYSGAATIMLMKAKENASLTSGVLAGRESALFHVAMHVDRLHPDAPHASDNTYHFTGQSSLIHLDHAGAYVELVTENLSLSDRDGDFLRVESVPWAVDDTEAAAEEVSRKLGLAADDRYSSLVFPDMATTNRMIFIGPDCYVDFVEPLTPDSPVARYLSRHGNGMYALVLEARDIDETAERLRRAHVPLAHESPVDLKVEWQDGALGVAARILSVDRRFMGGVQVFISEPAFPW